MSSDGLVTAGTLGSTKLIGKPINILLYAECCICYDDLVTGGTLGSTKLIGKPINICCTLNIQGWPNVRIVRIFYFVTLKLYGLYGFLS